MCICIYIYTYTWAISEKGWGPRGGVLGGPGVGAEGSQGLWFRESLRFQGMTTWQDLANLRCRKRT